MAKGDQLAFRKREASCGVPESISEGNGIVGSKTFGRADYKSG